MAGVRQARADFITGALEVTGEKFDAAAVERAVEQLGHKVERSQADQATRESLIDAARRREIIAVVAAALLVGFGGVMRWLEQPILYFVPPIVAAMVIAGRGMAVSGFRALIRLRLDMDFLMSAAAIGAAALGEWTEAGVIVVLYSISGLLESLSVERSRRAVRTLMSLAPRTADLIRQGIAVSTPISAVNVGDLVLVKPGTLIPVDGVVRAGRSTVNQASITGESLPVDREAGERVLAGSLNGAGALQITVEKAPGDTTLDHIIRLVEEAQRSKTPLQTSIERFARYYTPAVVILATILAAAPPLIAGAEWSVWIYRALTLLMISCPCALVLATPVTLVSAMAAAAKAGVLVKGGRELEALGSIRAVAFDKTGTVTEGRLEVDAVEVLDGVPPREMLRLAASVESHSEHPIARAILNRANAEGIAHDSPVAFTSLPGRGAFAEVGGRRVFVGNHALFEERNLCDGRLHQTLESVERASRTAMLVGSDDGVIGLIGISDQIRSEARGVVEELKSLGVDRAILLTGDNHRTGDAVGRTLGMDAVESELLPQDKVKAVERLRAGSGGVIMVGDGVNDAPALAAAEIGVAVGRAGADAAIETADVVLMKGDLTRLPWIYSLSKRARLNVRTNIALALGVKGLFLMLAAMGSATLWMALLADTGVALLVIGNGLRMLRG